MVRMLARERERERQNHEKRESKHPSPLVEKSSISNQNDPSKINLQPHHFLPFFFFFFFFDFFASSSSSCAAFATASLA